MARYALEQWLREDRKMLLREEVAAYATAVGGTRDDLDPVLEAASIDSWPRPKRRKRKR